MRALLAQLFDKHPSLSSFIQVIDAAHGKAMMAYIGFMSLRILELHRVLKPTGSVYLHCDSTASHYLKTVMDTIFGANNFHNEIIWQRNSSRGKGQPICCTEIWREYGYDFLLYKDERLLFESHSGI